MATIKVFDSDGCKVLSCFDTLDNVEYLDEIDEQIEPVENNPFE